MKRYRVEFTYCGTVMHDVEAENEDDAIDIAAIKQESASYSILDAVLDGDVVTSIVELTGERERP